MVSKLFLLVVAFAAFITFSNAEFECPGCQCTNFGGTPLRRGDLAPVCIQLVTNTSNLAKTALAVTTDEFSVISIDQAHTYVGNNAQKVEVRLMVQTDVDRKSIALPLVQWNNGTASFYGNLYSMVIRLDQGKVISLIWDNTCALCADTNCLTQVIDGTLANLCNMASTCAGSNLTSCDPKVYISWIGTDADGLTLTSSGLRLSRFVEYSVLDFYRQAKDLVQTTVSDIKSQVSG